MQNIGPTLGGDELVEKRGEAALEDVAQPLALDFDPVVVEAGEEFAAIGGGGFNKFGGGQRIGQFIFSLQERRVE